MNESVLNIDEFNEIYSRWVDSPYYNSWTDNKILAEPYMESLGIFKFRRLRGTKTRKYIPIGFEMKGYGCKAIPYNNTYEFGRTLSNSTAGAYGLLCFRVSQDEIWLLHYER